jgi:hypothetical protein
LNSRVLNTTSSGSLLASGPFCTDEIRYCDTRSDALKTLVKPVVLQNRVIHRRQPQAV